MISRNYAKCTVWATCFYISAMASKFYLMLTARIPPAGSKLIEPLTIQLPKWNVFRFSRPKWYPIVNPKVTFSDHFLIHYLKTVLWKNRDQSLPQCHGGNCWSRMSTRGADLGCSTRRGSNLHNSNSWAENYGLQVKSGPQPALDIMFYWNAAMFIHLCIVYSCFCTQWQS